MTDKLDHDAWTVPDAHRRGYLGKFQTPMGVNYVREPVTGFVSIFPDERTALLAAYKAKDEALNRDRPPSPGAQVFRIHRNGKSVRTEAVRRRERR